MFRPTLCVHVLLLLSIQQGVVGQPLDEAAFGRWAVWQKTCSVHQTEPDSPDFDTVYNDVEGKSYIEITRDSVTFYELDYEDSMERNCYMRWPFRFEARDDTLIMDDWYQMDTIDDGFLSEFYRVEVDGDSLRLVFKYWWDTFDGTAWYHETKVSRCYRYAAELPPGDWPAQDCRSQSQGVVVSMARRQRPRAPQRTVVFSILGRHVQQCGVNALFVVAKNGRTSRLLSLPDTRAGAMKWGAEAPQATGSLGR